MTELTRKQTEFFNSRDARINILQGSVSSGKTFSSLCKWGWVVRLSPPDATFLMAGRTQTTLKRNCLAPLQSLFGEDNFTYSMSSKTGKLFGHLVYLEGADNERAEDKIRGITLDGAYLDEATLMPQSFFTMLLSRLRKKGAFLYCTTNPDNPMHWLKADYIDRADELDVKVWNFRLEDNTFLPPEYVENIRKEYTGVFYRRFIEGEWVIADGLVYSAFDEETMLIDPPSLEELNRDYAEKYIGIDYGIENPTAFDLFAWHKAKKEWHMIKDYAWGGRDNVKPKTDPEIYDDLCRFADGIEDLRACIVDPSAKSLIVLMQRERLFKVIPADNDVLAGISFTNTMFSQGKLKVSKACKNSRAELFAYSWDTEKSRQQGKDCVIKTHDHNMDAMRYFCNTIVKPKTRLYGVVMPTDDRIIRR